MFHQNFPNFCSDPNMPPIMQNFPNPTVIGQVPDQILPPGQLMGVGAKFGALNQPLLPPGSQPSVIQVFGFKLFELFLGIWTKLESTDWEYSEDHSVK